MLSIVQRLIQIQAIERNRQCSMHESNNASIQMYIRFDGTACEIFNKI